MQAIEEATGKKISFVEDCMSTSRRHVLRGIHGDNETWKLVNVLKGSAYTVIVNCNPLDLNFGKWEAFTLSEDNRQQVLVPPNYGTAHLVMSDEVLWQYKFTTSGYQPAGRKQFTYRFDDPRFNIWWPVKNPILSDRDERAGSQK